MEIKQEKQFTLPQLIEWGFNNPCLAKERVYKIDDENDRFTPYVSFHADGSGVRIPCTITHDNTFTVEVEEEITEDTKFKRLVYIDDDDDTVAFSNFTIRELKDNGVKEFHAYIDGEFKLVWRNGKMVE